MAPANVQYPVGDLPLELHDKIWEATLGINGPAVIHCLELDLMQGQSDIRPRLEDWFRPLHEPGICAPTHAHGGHYTFDASWYLHVRNVSNAGFGACSALQRLQQVLRLKRPADVLALQAKEHPESGQETCPRALPEGKFPIWINTRKDILLLQSPSYFTDCSVTPYDKDIRVNWFSPLRWAYSTCASFRPLPFFGLDRVERFAIDWNMETTRGSIHPTCHEDACNVLRRAYDIELYHTRREDRKYCSPCLAGMLNALNRDVRDGRMTVRDFRMRMHDQFKVGSVDTATEEKLGFDEEGTFTCTNCDQEELCTTSRVPAIVENAPRVVSRVGWQPECHAWHRPGIETDIETLLMGRMPALRTLYVFDGSVRLAQRSVPGLGLSRPHEVFEGYNCKFVEVDPTDPQWDLSPREFPRHHPLANHCPFHSFTFADHLRQVAWRHASCQHAQALMDEQWADRDPYDAADSDDEEADMVEQDEWDDQEIAAQAAVPLEKAPLNDPIWVRTSDRIHMEDLEMLMMGYSPSLESQWPDHLLPVKVKILARIQPSEYYRLYQASATE